MPFSSSFPSYSTPNVQPTFTETTGPTFVPSLIQIPETVVPTYVSTTVVQTSVPTTEVPTNVPTTEVPTFVPTTLMPTSVPTKRQSQLPKTVVPTSLPSLFQIPETLVPTTKVPTSVPTTIMPTSVPSQNQLLKTVVPTSFPTIISHSPSSILTLYPSEENKNIPTLEPTEVTLSLISKISFNVTQVKVVNYICYNLIN